jgi:hypothetical protein
MKQLVTIDAKGRITLSQDILDLLRATPGDEVGLWIMVVPKGKTVFGQKEENPHLWEESPLRPRSAPVQALERLLPEEDAPPGNR